MRWAAVLARFGLTSARVVAPQTLAAASRRQREGLERARAALAAVALAEPATPPAVRVEVRLDRIALEAAAEALRMRADFFRSDRLTLGGTSLVDAASTSRSGDSLGALSASVARLARDAEALLDRARGATSAADGV